MKTTNISVHTLQLLQQNENCTTHDGIKHESQEYLCVKKQWSFQNNFTVLNSYTVDIYTIDKIADTDLEETANLHPTRSIVCNFNHWC